MVLAIFPSLESIKFMEEQDKPAVPQSSGGGGGRGGAH